MMPVSIEAFHPGPVPQRKGKRGKPPGGPLPSLKGRRKKSKPHNVNDPLSQLYGFYSANKRSLEGAPRDLLEKAAKHVKQRIEGLKKLRAERPTRIRAQLRWLRRWSDMIGGQL